jgi:uncharacterized protein
MTQRRPDRILGGLHDDFWARCDAGMLCLQSCASCGHLAWPVAEECPRCAGRSLDWRELCGRGTLASWCSFERRYYGELLPCPWDTILVQLAEGPLFVSNPSGFSNVEASLGMPLRLVFLDCEDAAGRFRLPAFERDQQGPR